MDVREENVREANVGEENVGEAIRTIIAEVLETPADGLSGEQHFRSLPNVDSMRILQIILKTEKFFDIEMEDDVTFRIQTIGEFQTLVEELCRGRAAA